jgi:hypothetical protein
VLRREVGVRRSLLAFLPIILFFPAKAQSQRGAITVPRNLVQLTSRAATIVRGRVVYARVEPHPQYHNLTSVLVVMSVGNVLKGPARQTLTFRQFIWDPRDRADASGYRRGEELLLFLNPETDAGFTSPVGLTQGRFRVLRGATGEPMVVNGVKNRGLLQGAQILSSARRLSRRAQEALARPPEQAGPMHLSVMEEMVHALSATQGDGR